jgi:hypothetical protein
MFTARDRPLSDRPFRLPAAELHFEQVNVAPSTSGVEDSATAPQSHVSVYLIFLVLS